MNIKVTHINIHRNINPELTPYASDIIEVFTDAPTPTIDEGVIEFSVSYGKGVEFCKNNYPDVKIYLDEHK